LKLFDSRDLAPVEEEWRVVNKVQV